MMRQDVCRCEYSAAIGLADMLARTFQQIGDIACVSRSQMQLQVYINPAGKSFLSYASAQAEFVPKAPAAKAPPPQVVGGHMLTKTAH